MDILMRYFVICVMEVLDGRLCRGSDAEALKVWNKYTGVCALTIEIGDSICAVQMTDGR
jgi:hypothetical protein